VNGFWVGGYENGCRWYGKLAETTEAPPLTVLATALGLLFGVLAVGVKLTVVHKLQPAAREATPVVAEPVPVGVPEGKII
jgi:hypothetical protein